MEHIYRQFYMKRNKCRVSIKYRVYFFLLTTFVFLAFTACGSSSLESDVSKVEVTANNTSGRSKSPTVLIPQTGPDTEGNDIFTLDYSNSQEGYIILIYKGSNDKTKFQITGEDQITYTYNIPSDLETVIPLSSGKGNYNVTLYENIGSDQYSVTFADDIFFNVENTFGSFLYPNQYVNFNKDTLSVIKATDITKDATCELEVVGLIYDFVINNVTYDDEEAENVASNYLPVVDEVLSSGKGICFDYAALMAAMLRSQGVPTKLEIGYAKDAYHAWVSVYTKDQGWIGGIIQFDGAKWTLMDPTLASNRKDSSKIKEYIGDGSSYVTKYSY